MRTHALIALLLLAGTAGLAHAQAPINPRTLISVASADHDATQDGVILVTRYDVQWFAAGASAPFSTGNLGKPVPDPATREVRVDVTTTILGFPVGNGYAARVAAIGPGGSGVSEPSAPFDVALRSPTAPTGVGLIR